jgi:type II restriction/modification system DNA methylase subunit YeeA
VGGVVKDVWTVAPMDETQRARTIQEIIRKKEIALQQVIVLYEAGLSENLIPEFRQALEEFIARLRAYVVADAPLDPLPKPNFRARFQRNEDGSMALRSTNEEI